MSPKIKPFANPLYTLLLAVGVLFLITVSAYGVLTVKMLAPESAKEIIAAQAGIMYTLDRYGVAILLVQLAVLALLTVGAITTDDYWQARGESTEKKDDSKE